MTLEPVVSCPSSSVVLDAGDPQYHGFFGQMLATGQGISNRVGGYEVGTAYVRLTCVANGKFRVLDDMKAAHIRSVIDPLPVSPVVHSETHSSGQHTMGLD